jgi:UDP-N-acetylglucosamine 2-epimerase (non-hydrolysing)
MKIVTIVGTRPEIIKLSRLIAEIDLHFDHKIIHTGQNFDYELNEIFFKELDIRRPDYFLNAVGKNVGETIGLVISKSYDTLLKINPDAVIVYGDTNSCLSVISAKRLKIPVFHFEAGNRSFDQRVPEELNRKIIDHLSDINFPVTEHARKYLLSEGLSPDRVIKSGSPMKEILDFYKPKINSSKILNKLKLKEKKYFLISSHREENIDYENNFNDLIDSLNSISDLYNYPIIFSTHPRTMKKIQKLDKDKLRKNINILKPLGFFDYNFLQINALCVISDSGTITEESSILNFPAITIRNAHERPEGMDEGVVIMTGLKKNEVLKSLKIVIDHHSRNIKTKLVDDYNIDNFSTKVVRVITGYIKYVNRIVWRKEI